MTKTKKAFVVAPDGKRYCKTCGGFVPWHKKGSRAHSRKMVIRTTKGDWNHVTDRFEQHLKGALNKRTIVESQKPTTGIWYYIYYRPTWVREVFRHDEFGPTGHDHAWKHYIVPKLAKHYKLSDRRVLLVDGMYRSMPRGRVDISVSTPNFIMKGEEIGMWYAFHGNDFPIWLNRKVEETSIINEFSLNGPAAHSMVKFRYAAHETMIDDMKLALQKIIGKVQ